MIKKIFLLTLAAVLFASFVSAGHMKLLAVSENNGTLIGSIADLNLEINDGKGRVFIQSLPLTKLDTQISTRLAQSTACKMTSVKCSEKDFLYSITSKSPIIGGPSAGAAISALTFAELEGLEVDESVSITGTINSGGLIGPVAGIKEKIEAAANHKIKKVLIPQPTHIQKDNNKTIELIEHGQSLGVEVKEVATFDEVIYELTGVSFAEPERNISISKEYTETMKQLAKEQCNRSKMLYDTVLRYKMPVVRENNSLMQLEENANNKSSKGLATMQKGEYYSAASYCYTSNLLYRQLLLNIMNMTNEDILANASSIMERVNEFDSFVEERKYTTLSELETYMIVKERIKDSKHFLEQAIKNARDDKTDVALVQLANGMERLFSSKAWDNFYTMGGQNITVDEEAVKQSCKTKITEARERYAYLKLFLPGYLSDTERELKLAEQDLNRGDYELCLFKASKAKADANAVILAMGLRESTISDTLGQKLEIVEQIIAEQSNKGKFPIIAYSYYEYANSLKGSDDFAGMLYAEYALELSNLDSYMGKDNPVERNMPTKIRVKDISWQGVFVFLWGLVIGVVLVLLILKRKK